LMCVSKTCFDVTTCLHTCNNIQGVPDYEKEFRVKI
jgi:hypothetical protein